MHQFITLTGRLGSDPEMRYTPSGDAVTNFSVATTRRWTGADGQAQERTIWWRIATWRKLAETCNQYLSKGRQVQVVGTVEEPHAWIDANTGAARAALQVTAQQVIFLGSRDDNGGGGSQQSQNGTGPTENTQPQGNPAPQQSGPAQTQPVQSQPVQGTLDGEDIPF